MDLQEGDYLLISGLVVEFDSYYQSWYSCGRGPDNHTDLTRPMPSYLPNGFVGGCYARVNEKVEFDTAGLAVFSLDTTQTQGSGCDIKADIMVTADQSLR